MSKSRKRRILGMTSTQFVILGCLALTAIGTIFGSFILISSSTTPGGFSVFPTRPSGSTTAPDQVRAPAGPFSIPTFPGDEQIPSNWKQYSSTTIEIWAPPQFESVNPKVERQQRIESYRAAGYGLLADKLVNDPSDFRLWFNFPQPETVIYNTHIIVKSDILPTFTLAEYIDGVYGLNLGGFQVIDRQEITIGDLQAQRILLRSDLTNLSIGLAEYVITDEVNLWTVSCGSDIDEFYSWLPEFDRIATSFRLLY